MFNCSELKKSVIDETWNVLICINYTIHREPTTKSFYRVKQTCLSFMISCNFCIENLLLIVVHKKLDSGQQNLIFAAGLDKVFSYFYYHMRG